MPITRTSSRYRNTLKRSFPKRRSLQPRPGTIEGGCSAATGRNTTHRCFFVPFAFHGSFAPAPLFARHRLSRARNGDAVVKMEEGDNAEWGILCVWAVCATCLTSRGRLEGRRVGCRSGAVQLAFRSADAGVASVRMCNPSRSPWAVDAPAGSIFLSLLSLSRSPLLSLSSSLFLYVQGGAMLSGGGSVEHSLSGSPFAEATAFPLSQSARTTLPTKDNGAGRSFVRRVGPEAVAPHRTRCHLIAPHMSDPIDSRRLSS